MLTWTVSRRGNHCYLEAIQNLFKFTENIFRLLVGVTSLSLEKSASECSRNTTSTRACIDMPSVSPMLKGYTHQLKNISSDQWQLPLSPHTKSTTDVSGAALQLFMIRVSATWNVQTCLDICIVCQGRWKKRRWMIASVNKNRHPILTCESLSFKERYAFEAYFVCL